MLQGGIWPSLAPPNSLGSQWLGYEGEAKDMHQYGPRCSWCAYISVFFLLILLSGYDSFLFFRTGSPNSQTLPRLKVPDHGIGIIPVVGSGSPCDFQGLDIPRRPDMRASTAIVIITKTFGVELSFPCSRYPS